MLDQANDGSIFLLDAPEYRLRKFQVGGTIQTIAGTGTNGVPNTTAPATSQPILAASAGQFWDSFVVDPTTGDVYMSQSPANISKLSHTTGVWSTVGGAVPSSSYPVGLYGFDGQNVLGYTYVYVPATNAYNDSFLTLYPTAGGSGTALVGSATAPIAGDFCADGTSATGCMLPVYHAETRTTYDSANARWLLLAYTASSIRYIGTAPGSTMQTLLVVPKSILAFAYQAPSQSQGAAVYYCASDGHLYKNDLNGNDTLIGFPFSGMKCTGRSLLLDTTRNSLIFIYGENGLYGIGEYSLN